MQPLLCILPEFSALCASKVQILGGSQSWLTVYVMSRLGIVLLCGGWGVESENVG